MWDTKEMTTHSEMGSMMENRIRGAVGSVEAIVGF
jgi:hypothetical protein